MSNSPVKLPAWTEPDPDETAIARSRRQPLPTPTGPPTRRHLARAALELDPARRRDALVAARRARRRGLPRPLLVQRYARLAEGA